MKLTQSLSFALIGALSYAPSAIAQQAKQRWFEIEVVMFQQLGDKTALKENFDIDLAPVKLNRPRDLLSQHINPDLSATKALIPVCGNTYDTPHIETASVLETEFQVADLQSINDRELTPDEIFDFQQRDQQFIEPEDNTLSLNSGFDGEGYARVESIDDLFGQDDQPVDTLSDSITSDTEDVFVSSLTPEEQAQLQAQVAEAQHYFDEQQFSYDYSIPSDICLLSEDVLAQLKQADSSFDEDYFALDTIPRKILRVEDIYSTQPYLMSDNSLELHDIVVQLRRSKNFRPLLHVGWRQPAISKRRSRPMRLFAGENLKYAHEKAMKAYQAELEAQNELSLALNLAQEALSDYAPIAGTVSSDTLLVNDVPTEPEPHPYEQIIAELKRGDIAAEQALETVTHTDDNSLEPEQLVMPVAPELDWTIDGLFNVHLNHYLYITAEFNVANKSLAEHETALLSDPTSQIEAIRFSQNRRVISKEVHYFDHPYMGMIVKIRRYKVPTREEETE